MIKCKTCDQGNLIQKKQFRMSKIVVFIGYIFLIPSILGMLFGGIVFIAGVSISSTDGGTGAFAIGLGVAIFIIIFSIVGGLLGWLLIMKKKVLQCNFCSAIVAIE